MIDRDKPTQRGHLQQRTAMTVLSIGLVALAWWVVHGFMSALAWAVVLTIATWPLYERYLLLFDPKRRTELAPFLFTLLIALVFIVPFGVGVVEVRSEVTSLFHWITQAEKTGVPVPPVVARIPLVGQQIMEWWTGNLSSPGSISDLIGRTDTSFFARITQLISLLVAQRLALFVFTIFTLFFLFRNGIMLGQQFRTLCRRLLGQSGEHLASLTVSAIRSTADGLVLVGLGEGAVLGVAYGLLGVPHPALLGAFTGLLAIIPFGAPVMFSLASLVLIMNGDYASAAVIFVLGWIMIGVVDYFIRPALIGGAAKLPFLLVLLGIFGGLETFGLVGLFLGPAIMAAAMSLWREWTESEPRRLMQKAS
jgi:predicted PurR-regulated permease PerM